MTPLDIDKEINTFKNNIISIFKEKSTNNQLTSEL